MKNKTSFYKKALLFSALFVVCWAAFALEQIITLSGRDNWAGVIQMENIVTGKGKWGNLDLTLEDGEYTSDSDTQVLMHFNSTPFLNDTGLFTISQPNPLVSALHFVYGQASGAFEKSTNTLTLTAESTGFFAPQDFTIEFWLAPTNLEDFETILLWKNSFPAAGSRTFIQQKIECSLDKRVLVWQFENFFYLDKPTSFTLRGKTPLLPRQWHHHLIRFNSASGMLEYDVDGIPEDIIYTTQTGKEDSTVYLPKETPAARLALGVNYTGLVDEFRLSKKFVEHPVLSRYLSEGGSCLTKIFDLGFAASQLKQVKADYRTPSDSSIFFYYRSTDTLSGYYSMKSYWVPFKPNEELEKPVKNRYIQLRMDFFPSGDKMASPSLSELSLLYLPSLPPTPPAFVRSYAGNGSVTLVWQKVNDQRIVGYLIYYGEEPGRYLGTGSRQGDSPLTVLQPDSSDNTITYTIDGLENGQLYYFALVSFDNSNPPQQSRFSQEVSARPSLIYPK